MASIVITYYTKRQTRWPREALAMWQDTILVPTPLPNTILTCAININCQKLIAKMADALHIMCIQLQ